MGDDNEPYFYKKNIVKCGIMKERNGVFTVLINGLLFLVRRDEIENAKGTVIITHGIAEHSGRYEAVTTFLNNHGYNVVRYDIRGHGQSQGKRGKLSSFHLVIDDLHELVLNEKKLKTKQIFLLGHSMGGLIVDLYGVTYHDVDGIISSAAPSYYLKDIFPLRLLGYKWLGFIHKKTDFSDGRLSRDQAVERAYEEDPLNLKHFYLSLVGQMFVSGVRYLNKHLKAFDTPILLMHGDADKICPSEFSKRLYDLLPVNDKQLIMYPESYHEILNDLDKDKVMQDMVSWLDKHVEVES